MARRVSLGNLRGSCVNQDSQMFQVEWELSYRMFAAFRHWDERISPSFTYEDNSLEFVVNKDDLVCLHSTTHFLFSYPVEYSFSLKNIEGNLIGTKTFTSSFEKTMADDFKFDIKEALIDCGKPLEDGSTMTIVFQLRILPEANGHNHLLLTETDELSENLRKLFINGFGSDTILRLKEKEFHAHRAILISRSSVFAAMFQHDTSEKQTGVINIPDCDPDSFQEFLEYVYSGKLEDISFDKTIHLYQTSDKYDIQKLKSFCLTCMVKKLTVQNVCEVVIFADQYNEKELFSAVQDFFNKHHKEIYLTNEWLNLMKMNNELANKLLIQMSVSETSADDEV